MVDCCVDGYALKKKSFCELWKRICAIFLVVSGTNSTRAREQILRSETLAVISHSVRAGIIKFMNFSSVLTDEQHSVLKIIAKPGKKSNYSSKTRL